MRALVAHGAHDLRLEDVAGQPLGPHDAEVSIAVGGICGSDLHYYHRGAVGDFAIREPLVLGHEIAGTVVRTGGEVDGLEPGIRVAIDPSLPCGRCGQCRAGARNLCTEMRFLGSAAPFPHAQGGFRERLVVDAAQCVPLPDSLTLESGVFAEPLAVAFHAAGRGCPLLGRRILVTGAGPIGVLIAVVARRAGAASVTVTDILDAPLEVARLFGATATVNVASARTDLPEVDIAFEASGSPQALDACLQAVRPGGRVVLVGLLPAGAVPVPANRVVTREVDVVGSFRFLDVEFHAAVGALASGLDVTPLLSARFALENAIEAFDAASRRAELMKVQLSF